MNPSGDAEQRLSTLFGAHHQAVLRYARRRTDDEHAADVVSDVFLIAWRRLDAIPADAAPWLIGVARRVLSNQYRSRTRTAALDVRLGQQRPYTIDLAEQVTVNTVWAAALKNLSPNDREVLALVAWEGLSSRQAAAALGCSLPAFQMKLHRARRRLLSLVDKDPGILANPHPQKEMFREV